MQQDHMNNDINKKEREEIHKSWFKEDTIDFWRHKQMYLKISPFAKYYKEAKWMTIGDGRYGLDSQRLNKLFGIKECLPTDISENMLKEAKSRNLLSSYSVENAEKLSFKDNSFDVIFCKEAFHHFPRPFVALYEMLRVAKEAVIFIEPNDNNVSNHNYEACGNYVYRLSNYEINKVVHGLDLGGVAYLTFNDTYIEGCEFEKADENNLLFSKIKKTILEQDSYGNKNMTTTIIFKNEIDISLKNSMISDGYIFPKKAINPYKNKSQNLKQHNNSMDFSKKYNSFYQKIELLQKEDTKYVIYGNGTIGKTLHALLKDKVVGYVDISEENRHPKNLLIMEYDKIIISVLGREEEICNYLTNDLNIDTSNIITLTI